MSELSEREKAVLAELKAVEETAQKQTRQKPTSTKKMPKDKMEYPLGLE